MAFLLTSLLACGDRATHDSFARGELSRANVLLVTIDTLRADRLGAYGSVAKLTPTLDRLAAEGVRYTHAWSHVPMTLPAHTSILTGLAPPHSGVRNNTTFRLDERTPTLATMLKQSGYRTGAFIGAFVLDGRFGLARGFDTYDDRLAHADRASFRAAERRAADVVRSAGDWIISNPQPPTSGPQSPLSATTPWFAWVHLFDPHAPYDAPAEYRPGRSAYDAEVAYTDAMLGTLLDRLRAAGQLQRTLVIVTADHGESLGDHGETTHGLFAYESTLRVPLILSSSGIRARTVETAAAHVDVVPTVLDLLGLTIPDRLDGVSLVQPPSANRAVYFEALDASLTRGWAPLRGVVQNGWKYIDLPEAELYDLTADPQEAHNQIGLDRRHESMARALAQLETTGGRAPTPSAIDATAAARLRSLGYTAAAAPTIERATVADDPKRLVAVNERFNTALTDFDEGRSEQALAGFRSVLAERPDFLSARTTAATALVSLNRGAEAVTLLREAPGDQLRSPETLVKLGAAFRATGDLRGAADAFERARAAGSQRVDLLEDLAVVYAALGRAREARALFEELVAKHPTGATAWYNLGLFELQSGHAPAAAAAFRRAVDREPAYGEAWHALGAALVDTDTAGAIDAWRHAERLMPRDYDLLFNLGMLSADHDAPANALPYLRRFVREAPPARYARDISRVQQVVARLERQRR